MHGRSARVGLKSAACLMLSLFVQGCGGATSPATSPAGQDALVRLDTESRRHIRHEDLMRRDTALHAPMKLDVSAIRPLLDEASVLPRETAAPVRGASGAGLAPESVLPDGQELHMDNQHDVMEPEGAVPPGGVGKAGGTSPTSIDIPNADGSITHVAPDGTVRTEKLISHTRSAQGRGG